MKKWLLICMMPLLILSVGVGKVEGAVPSTSTHAQAAALIDVTSGRMLYSQNGNSSLPIASLTKIMTAIVAIEKGDLSDRVKVGVNAYGKEGSSIYLKLGEEMSLEHLLYGLMLRSGNDAATAIAEHVGGSQEGFVHMMNEKAQELGLTHSSFANPHGLDERNHYSSANDLAELTAYAMRNPVFKEIVKTKVKRVPNPEEKWDRTWYNKNKMLAFYEGADGVKTGYTKIAKRCLVSSATRNGQQLVAVTINDGNDWADHSRLLDYGFANYPLRTIVEKEANVFETGFVASRTLRYPLAEEELDEIQSRFTVTKPNSVNYSLGERGKIHYMKDGRNIGSVILVEPGSPRLSLPDAPVFQQQSQQSSYDRGSFSSVVRHVLKEMFSGGIFR